MDEPEPERLKKVVAEDRVSIDDEVQGRVRNSMFDDMPQAVREPFEGIWRESIRLHLRWRLYRQLFGSEERVRLLNESAIAFFYQLQFIMQDEVVLACARLLDRTNGTMTLHYLLDRAEQTRGWRRVPTLEEKLTALEAQAVPFTKHRNSRIAHADIRHHPAMVGSVLPSITVDMVDEFLAGLRDFVKDFIEAVESGAPVGYPMPQMGDGDTLVYDLIKATDYDTLTPNAIERALRIKASKHGAAWTRVSGLE